jgi:hypothetical protein
MALRSLVMRNHVLGDVVPCFLVTKEKAGKNGCNGQGDLQPVVLWPASGGRCCVASGGSWYMVVSGGICGILYLVVPGGSWYPVVAGIWWYLVVSGGIWWYLVVSGRVRWQVSALLKASEGAEPGVAGAPRC